MIKFRFLVLFLILIFLNNKAYAYLDPGTVTLVIQSIIAGIAGFFVTLGLYWSKFKIFIKKMYLFFKSKSPKNK